MVLPKKNEARAHHFVPRCWLAGFTDSGENDGRLWVTDLKRKKQWPTTPANAGHIRDYNRLSHSQLDPLVAEHWFAVIEGEYAPLLRSLRKKPRVPTTQESEALLSFMAIQWARVPDFRRFALRILTSVQKEDLARALATPETWAAELVRHDIETDAPGLEYELVLKLYRSGRLDMNPGNDWYVMQTFASVDRILPGLRKRWWAIWFSESGSFIASDNPVSLEGEKGKMIGFENAEFVFYSLNRHMLLSGTFNQQRDLLVNHTTIAAQNKFTMIRCGGQIYSSRPDFSWLDGQSKVQYDWKAYAQTT